MRRLVIILGILALALAACNDEPPPTQIVIVVTATSEQGTAATATPDLIVRVVTATPVPPTDGPTKSPSPEKTKKPKPTALPTPTPLPPMFPTNVVAQVQIAEEVFEHGRMFWLRHNLQIWVMINVPPDNPAGDWYCYNDQFLDGQPEVDPSLVPPEGMYQPRRGFGLLWRNHPDLRAALGWGTTPEFDLTSNYTYIAGGYVENGKYYSGPGEHRLTTLYGQSISFFEGDIRGDCQGGTWRMTP